MGNGTEEKSEKILKELNINNIEIKEFLELKLENKCLVHRIIIKNE